MSNLVQSFDESTPTRPRKIENRFPEAGMGVVPEIGVTYPGNEFRGRGHGEASIRSSTSQVRKRRFVLLSNKTVVGLASLSA